MELNLIKNPDWQKADHVVIYKRGQGIELGATEDKIQQVAREGHESGTSGFQVQYPNHSARLPVSSLKSR